MNARRSPQQSECVDGWADVLLIIASVTTALLQLQEFLAWLTGNRPEFWEPSFAAQSKGREGKEAISALVSVLFLFLLISRLFWNFIDWHPFEQALFRLNAMRRKLAYTAVTRVRSAGSVTVQINVLTRGMTAHGFATGGPIDSIQAGGSTCTFVSGLCRSLCVPPSYLGALVTPA